ncbi:MAG: DNA polymerase III subunit gamma/tau [Candidatus Omnitrophica bacterium]|jgi:DNA polymerase-3 subunit gamma/tau|nr:DNA polymerase III subunit gamma/tau [Candidatus Omnitrophota bacterium]
MSYQAFALKYRPKNFSEVIGQRHVVTALKTAIEKNHIHHAYLFSGPRGCGKTSMARIFAKSLNCVNGPTITPCGKCPSCLEIAKGMALDVIEIDGASNRGIDDIRSLRENVKLSPIGAKYKVYIIDEVHQITSDGFNALLKTLEEPPSHVKFIFATTHPQKIIPTILSRCQKFQFTLLLLEDIVTKLKIITKSEKLQIPDSLLYAIARSAGGSIRDAESLLDQLAPVISQGGLVDDIFSFLGIIDEETLLQTLILTITKNLTELLMFVDKRVQEGKDLTILLNGLIEYLRVVLLSKVSLPAFNLVTDISPDGKKAIAEVSKKISAPEVLRAIDLLIEAKAIAKQLNTIRIPLELALIKFARREEVDYAKNQYQPKNPPVTQKPVMPDGNADISNADVKQVQKTGSAEIEKKTDNTMSVDFGDLDLENTELKRQSSDPSCGLSDKDDNVKDNMILNIFMNKWQNILLAMQRERVSIATHLSFAKPMSSSGKIIKIAFPESQKFHKEILEMPKNVEYIEKFVSKVMGKDIGIKFELIAVVSEPQEAEAVSVKSELLPDSIDDSNMSASYEGDIPKKVDIKQDDNEFINDLLDTFGGTIHTDD